MSAQHCLELLTHVVILSRWIAHPNCAHLSNHIRRLALIHCLSLITVKKAEKKSIIRWYLLYFWSNLINTALSECTVAPSQQLQQKPVDKPRQWGLPYWMWKDTNKKLYENHYKSEKPTTSLVFWKSCFTFLDVSMQCHFITAIRITNQRGL